MKEFEKRGAFWEYNRDKPEQPHVILSGGDHSDGFFNSLALAVDPRLVGEISRCLVAKLNDTESGATEKIDRVVGIARGGIVLAYDLAREIGAKSEQPCLTGYVEKNEAGRWQPSFSPKIHERILLCDDVFTSGASFRGAIACLEFLRPEPFIWPKILVLFNRSPNVYCDGRLVESLIHRSLTNWSPPYCRLCADGSKADQDCRCRGLGAINWFRLTRYPRPRSLLSAVRCLATSGGRGRTVFCRSFSSKFNEWLLKSNSANSSPVAAV
jgi:orotate phosphoribosyltransferase